MRTQRVSIIGSVLLLVACSAASAVETAAECRCGFNPATHRRLIGLNPMNRGVNSLGGDVCRWVNVEGVFPNPPNQRTVVTYSIVVTANETHSGETLEPIVDADFIFADTLAAIQEGMESWNDTAGITLQRVASGGQIRVGASTFPSSQVGLGGFSAESTGGPFFMKTGFVQLDKSDGSWTRNDVRAVTAHEAGHALGLNHTDLANTLMFPSNSSATGPVPDDRWYMQFLYGSARAKLSATATQNAPMTLAIGRASPKQTGTTSNDTFDNSAAAPDGPGKGTGSLTQNDVTNYIVERAGPGGSAFAPINSNVTAPSGGQNADPALTHAANQFNFGDSSLTTSGTYQYRVRAVHAVAGNDVLSDAVSIAVTVNSQPITPVITSALTASGTVGSAFNYSITANNSPTSFGATGLPAGLSVSAAGVISGTPTTAGSFNIGLSATNAAGSGTATLALTIETPVPPTITSTLSALGVVGTPFTYTITATASPTSFSTTALPAGLSLNAVNGEISGTPTVDGFTSVTLTATNAIGNGTATLALTIEPPPPVPPLITSELIASGLKDLAFSYTITASGDVPMTFQAIGLPAGLSITGNTISGTPTVSGGFAVTITATNDVGSDTVALALNIAKSEANIPPIFTEAPATPPVFEVGTEVTLTAPDFDDDDDALVFIWNFGDGTTLAAGATVTHVYETSGLFNVIVTLSDGTDTTNAEINVAITDEEPELGVLVGKLPNTFDVLKAKIAFNFKTPVFKDSLSITGTLPLPRNFAPNGKMVQVALGDVDLSTPLDLKGKAPNKTFTLKAKIKNGVYLASPGKFTLTLKKSTLFPDLQILGFSNDEILKPGVTIQTTLLISLNGVSYQKTISFLYTAKLGKKGAAKKQF